MLDSVQTTAAPSVTETTDILIAGTGFAGLCAAIRLQDAGNASFLMLEKAGDYGGTWRDNIYPGCACDIPSHLYSFSFEPKADWSRMFATQPEILHYLRGVADKHGLAQHTRFGAALREAIWDDALKRWFVHTEDGRVFSARVLISAMGPLHIPAFPTIPGAATFAGPAFHSSRWDFSVPLEGKRIAVIGTGASAIQFIPHLAGQASKLCVFQRTPPWITPKMDRAFSPEEKRQFGSRLRSWLFRQRLFWMHDVRALSFLGNRKMMELGEKIALSHLRRHIKDPVLRAKLTPDYRIGCKRVLISNDYYPALARETVELVTTPIASIAPDAVITTDGQAHPVDVIIYGTGFHTTDALCAVRIVGRNGLDLNTAFADGMHAYRGITVPDFPNLFFLLGPNTGLGHNSVVLMIEAQMRYLISLFAKMARAGWTVVDVKPSVEAAWNTAIQQKIGNTVWNAGGCKSWYLDANGRNTTIWPGFVAEYQIKMRTATLRDYARVA